MSGGGRWPGRCGPTSPRRRVNGSDPITLVDWGLGVRRSHTRRVSSRRLISRRRPSSHLREEVLVEAAADVSRRP